MCSKRRTQVDLCRPEVVAVFEEQVEAISALDGYRDRSHGDKKAKDAPDPMHGRVST
jgi:hypothetical protein